MFYLSIVLSFSSLSCMGLGLQLKIDDWDHRPFDWDHRGVMSLQNTLACRAVQSCQCAKSHLAATHHNKKTLTR